MKIPDVIPLWWKIAAAGILCALLWGAYRLWHHEVYQQGYDDAKTERAAADNKAISLRLTENVTLAAKQTADNATITKAKNDEIAPVIAAIRTGGVRIGTRSCGPAAAPVAPSTPSSPSPDPGSRLVSAANDADIKELMTQVEEALATGRACQAFVRKNGFTPAAP
jgi:hypothetical protein